jgi:hypothetical protein
MTESARYDATVEVSVWTNGSGLFALRVGRPDVRKYFPESLEFVILEFAGYADSVRVRLTPTFWTSCPELRNRFIGLWLRQQELVPWRTKGKPPRVQLTRLEEGRFRLSPLAEDRRNVLLSVRNSNR